MILFPKEETKMKTMLIGIGAAGNKAVLNAVEAGVMKVEDTVIINSTSKIFQKNILEQR